ncbi:WD repeat-containing protein 59 [Liparis tanakae]|uniref:WD repeat-containing protein 59 n=1 Tax=Liparis tanakae TaxID=230148 RepID=A0A4Z2EC05_9TELE|nr:WD repeat-containing protein 59 [Liparis tanakae]
MAARWSSENVVVEFRDAQATAMSVDCLGSHAVLSGGVEDPQAGYKRALDKEVQTHWMFTNASPLVRRRFLYMVNLEAPSEPPRKIGRQSKWDVGTVQWNPHRPQGHVFAASSNQRVDLYAWRDGCGHVHASLQGHTRVIR